MDPALIFLSHFHLLLCTVTNMVGLVSFQLWGWTLFLIFQQVSEFWWKIAPPVSEFCPRSFIWLLRVSKLQVLSYFLDSCLVAQWNHTYSVALINSFWYFHVALVLTLTFSLQSLCLAHAAISIWLLRLHSTRFQCISWNRLPTVIWLSMLNNLGWQVLLLECRWDTSAKYSLINYFYLPGWVDIRSDTNPCILSTQSTFYLWKLVCSNMGSSETPLERAHYWRYWLQLPQRIDPYFPWVASWPLPALFRAL